MKIICVGRNYRAHAAELHNEVPTEPVLFMKPETALALPEGQVPIPSFTKSLHHEIEIVLKICKDGRPTTKEEALSFFEEWTVGIDFTARDLQTKLKEKRLPWEIAKAFDESAVVGQFVPAEKKQKSVAFELKKNGITAQTGQTSDMLFPFGELLVQAARYFTLQKGDLIFTGTPAGVAPVAAGDRLEGFLEGKRLFNVEMI